MHRRRLVIGMLLVAGLAACGSDGDGGDDAETRTVSSSRGEVEVPADPQRVVALVGSADVDVLTLGLEPVFSGSFAEGWADLPDSTVTSDLVPPDPEAVAATEPDLLIGWDWLVDDPAWEGLAAIAPAVSLPEDPETTWRDVYLLVADAVNKRSEGEEQLAAFDERVAEVKARIGEEDPITVAQIGAFDPGSFWWWTADYPVNEHLSSVGIEVQSPAEEAAGVSLERLAEVTAPVIILSGAPEAIDSLKASPLWANLPAVQNDAVIEVDRSIWGGAGLIWSNRMLDEIERLFLS